MKNNKKIDLLIKYICLTNDITNFDLGFGKNRIQFSGSGQDVKLCVGPSEHSYDADDH